MLRFRLAKEVDGQRVIVEVWDLKSDPPRFVAGIYPHEDSITIVSKHFKSSNVDRKYPPKVTVSFHTKQDVL